jgi:hypothetical protein
MCTAAVKPPRSSTNPSDGAAAVAPTHSSSKIEPAVVSHVAGTKRIVDVYFPTNIGAPGVK